MKNNKGYSLVELLIAMAIFSLVMVGIASMMRSTAVSYKHGLYESEVQEEAQIVANQVTDLLIDATALVSASHPYQFKDADGNLFTLKKVGSTIVYTDGTGSHTLAENVSSFEISELGGATNADNRAKLKVGITLNGSKYESTKVVAFRNSIEDTMYNDLPHVGGTPAPTPSGYDAEVGVLRFGELNVSANYDIVENAQLNSTAQGFYELVESDNPHISGKKQYVLKLKSAYETNFDSSVLKSSTCELTGTDSKGNAIKLLLYTDKVEFGSGEGNIMAFNTLPSNGSGGLITYMDVKGIDMNAAASATTITYSTEWTADGVSPSYKATGGVIQHKNDCSNMQPQIGQPHNGSQGFQNQIGLIADPNSNGLWITKNNDPVANLPWGGNYLYDRFAGKSNKKAIFKIDIGGHTYDVDYKFYFQNEGDLANI